MVAAAVARLTNIQGDIWSKGFPKYFETYYFFTINAGRVKTFSQNLRKLANATEPLISSLKDANATKPPISSLKDANVPKPLISSLYDVKKDWDNIANLKKTNVARTSGRPLPQNDIVVPVRNALIAFTFKGLELIEDGLDPKDTLNTDLVGSCDPAFRRGMAEDKNLEDPDRETWDPLFRKKPEKKEIHGLLKIAGSSMEEINTRLGDIQNVLGYPNVISPVIDGTSDASNEVSRINGQTRPEGDRGKEHFGFEDHISQPLMVGIDEIPSGSRMVTDLKNLIVTTDTNVEGDKNDNVRPPWMLGGSFLVFRKLEQNVPGFEAAVAQCSTQLKLTKDHLKAKLMGRWPSGAPIAMPQFHAQDAQDAQDKDKAKLINDFAYTDDICPMSAHIRKTNPRGQVDANAFPRCERTKMIRNGIPYGRVGDPKVGLLFACYQAHIEDSFLEMQKWSNNAAFPKGGTGMDPIIGQKRNGEVVTFTNSLKDSMTGTKQTKENAQQVSFRQFVTLRGGEYFFAPSISALRDNLGQA